MGLLLDEAVILRGWDESLRINRQRPSRVSKEVKSFRKKEGRVEEEEGGWEMLPSSYNRYESLSLEMKVFCLEKKLWEERDRTQRFNGCLISFSHSALLSAHRKTVRIRFCSLFNTHYDDVALFLHSQQSCTLSVKWSTKCVILFIFFPHRRASYSKASVSCDGDAVYELYVILY